MSGPIQRPSPYQESCPHERIECDAFTLCDTKCARCGMTAKQLEQQRRERAKAAKP